MKCRHCWYNEDWKEEHLKRDQLTFDELERLARSITRIQFLSLTGGEAFRRPDIVDIAAMFARQTRLARYQIPTSGFLPDLIASSTERMLRVNAGVPFRVDVSLDGTKETHDRVRNIKGGYERAITTVHELNRLKRRYPYFDVGVITTISRSNQDEVDEIAAVVEEVNPDGEWMVNIVRGEPRDPNATSVDVDKYWRAHEIIDQRIRQGRYKGHGGHMTAPWLSAKNATRRKVIKRILKGQCNGGGVRRWGARRGDL
jgi:MoaA/NifB/PqqE/SkfB family radical SAM enzyme